MRCEQWQVAVNRRLREPDFLRMLGPEMAVQWLF